MTIVLLLLLIINCILNLFVVYTSMEVMAEILTCYTNASQTGGCDDCFPDPNFPVDDDEDFMRKGLTVPGYNDLLLGLRLSDSRRTVYDTITSTDTSKTASILTTTGSLFKRNFCLINSDIIGSPLLKHDMI